MELGNLDVSSYLENFTLSKDSKGKTKVKVMTFAGQKVKQYINEFWTSKQRQASSIHEISYRACFKPQLPRFFINMFTKARDVVYDPFSGRGTTVIEAGLLNRNIISNDINPLSRIMAYPRCFIPKPADVEKRLSEISFDERAQADIDLSMFYHPRTEGQIVSLKKYLVEKKAKGTEDFLDSWIRMVATNRLTGHSSGFFSVYTLPPNQAVSPKRQKKINKKRNQTPDYRDIKALILKKTKSLVKDVSPIQVQNLYRAGSNGLFLSNDARYTNEIPEETVQLTVTSPPFLNIVQYERDNWLRCWFNDIDASKVAQNLTMESTIEGWSKAMQKVLFELYRVTKKGGWVAFEVGEVSKGQIKLDEVIVPLGLEVGFACKGILVNLQEFTKTSNIWGIKNNKGGTNTNRIVIFTKN